MLARAKRSRLKSGVVGSPNARLNSEISLLNACSRPLFKGLAMRLRLILNDCRNVSVREGGCPVLSCENATTRRQRVFSRVFIQVHKDEQRRGRKRENGNGNSIVLFMCLGASAGGLDERGAKGLGMNPANLANPPVQAGCHCVAPERARGMMGGCMPLF